MSKPWAIVKAREKTIEELERELEQAKFKLDIVKVSVEKGA